MSPDDVWYSVAEAADRLGITPRHLRRLVSRGDLTAYRLGRSGRPRYRLDDIDRLIQRCDQASEEGPHAALDDFINQTTNRGTP